MNRNQLHRFITAITGVRDPAALGGIERIMRRIALHASLEFCSREELIRNARIAASAWRGPGMSGPALAK